MSSNNPLELIEQYLDRVRVYLPLDSEDTIIELQTHLIEEAERIGNGTMTAGSAMMAIERMGDPKSVANEYAGSGEKVGPVPAEYVRGSIVLTLLWKDQVALDAASFPGGHVVGRSCIFANLLHAGIDHRRADDLAGRPACQHGFVADHRNLFSDRL